MWGSSADDAWSLLGFLAVWFPAALVAALVVLAGPALGLWELRPWHALVGVAFPFVAARWILRARS